MLYGLLSEEFIKPFGEELAEMLGIPADKNGLYKTNWGRKTKEGLAKSVVTVIQDTAAKAANPVGNHPILQTIDNDKDHLERVKNLARHALKDTLPLKLRDYCIQHEISQSRSQQSVMFWIAAADYYQRKI